MIRRPPRSTQSSRRQRQMCIRDRARPGAAGRADRKAGAGAEGWLSLIHISEPTRLGMISYAVFCLKKKDELLGRDKALTLRNIAITVAIHLEEPEETIRW